jgi:hypothetical protein
LLVEHSLDKTRQRLENHRRGPSRHSTYHVLDDSEAAILRPVREINVLRDLDLEV